MVSFKDLREMISESQRKLFKRKAEIPPFPTPPTPARLRETFKNMKPFWHFGDRDLLGKKVIIVKK